MNKFSKKVKAFIYYRARYYDRATSVLRAGYKAKDRITAAKIGYILEQKLEILEAIEKEKLEVFDTNMITEEYILTGLKEIAQNGKQEANRVRAWELLGKYLAMFTERVETKDVTDYPPERRNRLLNMVKELNTN